MTTFKDFVPDYLAPPWLLQPKGRRMLEGLGLSLDELVLRAKDGVKARFPTIAPRDALGTTAFERGLPRGAGESDAAWAARLQAAFDIWYWAGTPYGVLRALYTAGYLPQLVIGQGLEYELDASTGLVLSINSWGGPFDFTGLGTSFWSAFILYFPTSRWPSSWTSAGAPPLASSDEAQSLMSLVARWRPAYETFARVVLGDAVVWGFPPVWGTSRTWGGSGYWSWTPPT